MYNPLRKKTNTPPPTEEAFPSEFKFVVLETDKARDFHTHIPHPHRLHDLTL